MESGSLIVWNTGPACRGTGGPDQEYFAVTYWSITVYDLDSETRQRLQAWVDDGLTADWLKAASELRIYCVSDENTSIMEAAEPKGWG